MKEHLDESGALGLARRIEKYWAAQGKTVVCTVHEIFSPVRSLKHHNHWAVRSNMQNGLPTA